MVPGHKPAEDEIIADVLSAFETPARELTNAMSINSKPCLSLAWRGMAWHHWHK